MNPDPLATRSFAPVRAPAKINLHLRVAPPSPDGFHPLLTWMCTVSLFDTLTIAPADRESPLIRLTCDDPALPCDGSNLIVRAGMALAEGLGRSTREGGNKPLPPVDIALTKRIPSGAGLGGGSADGAFAMMALNRFWRVGVSPERLADWSAACGSDLPFFFHGPSSICTGRGERVRPVSPPVLARWGVLVLPRIAMPTPAVYRKFDEMKLGETRALTDAVDWDGWARLPARELLARLVNDLEAPAFAIRRDLAELRAGIELSLGRPVRMSGSGSSLFTLFDDAESAQAAADSVAERWDIKAVAVEIAPHALVPRPL